MQPYEETNEWAIELEDGVDPLDIAGAVFVYLSNNLSESVLNTSLNQLVMGTSILARWATYRICITSGNATTLNSV